MSESTRETHDPLRALRDADHRPVPVVWRERVAARIRGLLGIVAQPDDVSVSGRFLSALVAAALLFVAWQAYVASDPPIEDSLPFAAPDATSPPSSSSELEDTHVVRPTPTDSVVVHVAGAVATPGIAVGEASWRVHDAISAAGGATAIADIDRLNLAAPVEDGQRIYVPAVGEDDVAMVVDDVVAVSGGGGETRIDINAATAGSLEELPGVGPVTAAAIVSHRDTHGSFASVDALVAVRGIGSATLEGLRDFATAG